MVDIEFDSRELESGFKVDFLDFCMSFRAEDHGAVEFILVERNVICISRFASDLFQRRHMIEWFSDDFLFTIDQHGR